MAGIPGCTRSSSDYLRVEGDKILDDTGSQVHLRGFNIGFRDFNGLLGEEDIARIAAHGANAIRLWFKYTDFEPEPYRYSSALALLDNIFKWCEKHGVYAILCNHLAQGGQNRHDFVVRGSPYTFWKEKENQSRFYSLWAMLAGRYASSSAIAGYDLLNEGTPPSIDAYREVLNRAARRVREHDGRHMLIVEEARIPTHSSYSLVPVTIEDGNTIYSVHFYYPARFTMYTVAGSRTVTSYPGEMKVAGEKIGEARSPSLTGSHGWRKVSVEAAPPGEAEILLVRFVSKNNTGKIWADDTKLRAGGREIELPAPLVSNPSFETGFTGSWRTEDGEARVVEGTAHSGERSMLLGNTEHALAKSSPIEVKNGKYRLSAWVKSERATGDNYIAISWHRARVVAEVDRAKLEAMLKYALDFKNSHSVPLFVGEISAQANPSKSSVLYYLSDLLGIMQEHELHWCFWSYYSHLPGIGLYSGNEPQLSRPEVAELLESYMK